MDETKIPQKDSFHLIHLPQCNSVESINQEDDKLSEFTLNSEHHMLLDFSDYPSLSNVKLAESQGSRSSKKSESQKVSSDDNIDKNNSSKGKSEKHVEEESLSGSQQNTDEEEVDVDENISFKSEKNEGKIRKCLDDRDGKAKSCCLCLIL